MNERVRLYKAIFYLKGSNFVVLSAPLSFLSQTENWRTRKW